MSLLQRNQSTVQFTFTKPTMTAVGIEIDELLGYMNPETEHLSSRPQAITVFQKSAPDPKASIPGTWLVEGYTAIVTIDAGPAT